MGLNIKNPEAVRLAHEVAGRTGETVTGAIAAALRERLERLDADSGSLADRLLAIGQDCAARLDPHSLTLDHGELLYDEHGLPPVIVETSALVAILRAEPEASHFARAIEAAPVRRLSAASYVEVGAVIDGARDPVASRRVDELIAAAGIIIEPVTASQARIARQAYRDFGKESGHPAGLNFGDCFSYALAMDTSEPLLYKGGDFTATGISQAR